MRSATPLADSAGKRPSTAITRHSVTALRVALGLVFLGFGVLKFFPGVSPAAELAQRTIGELTLHHVGPGPALLLTAIMETVIGLTLVTGKFLKSGLVLLAMALVGIMSPLVLFFDELFPAGGPTLTAQYVHAVRGTNARILDTRKTTPGWRKLERYAVRCGGGMSHRSDLEQAVLIKDNHIAALGDDVGLAVHRARAVAPSGTRIEVECDEVAQVGEAISAGADIILLDNMGLQDMRDAVKLVAGRAVIEASGGVNLQTVRGIAETGVNWISVGALTHSAPALDLALDFEE